MRAQPLVTASVIAGLTGFASTYASATFVAEIGIIGDIRVFTEAELALAGQITPNATGGFTWIQGSNTIGGAGPGWTIENGQIDFSPNPSISATFDFTNVSGSDADFIFSVSGLSTVAFDDPAVDGDSIITLLDNGSNTATLEPTTGEALYTAFIGTDEVVELFPDTPSATDGLSAPANGFDLDADSFGFVFDNGSTPELSIGEAFGFEHEFFLTDGDQVTFNSDFNIVPEPSSLALLAAGLAVIGVRRRTA